MDIYYVVALYYDYDCVVGDSIIGFHDLPYLNYLGILENRDILLLHQ
jgi:hypothetical protein